MVSGSSKVRIVDSHTAGEPTRVVVSGGPSLGTGPLPERLERFREQHDGFRAGVTLEPRGSEVLVGALLVEPLEATSAAGVIFFNNTGYLGMCGHGTIGLVATLAHLGRIGPGEHRIETPVGVVTASLKQDGSVTVENVPSYRARKDVTVEVPGYGSFAGDIAWGGNWFFLIGEHGLTLDAVHCVELTRVSAAILAALAAHGITAPAGEPIDHIEFFSPAHSPQNHSRNFVLCPGGAFDRSPCGTGTSAKMACLHADGKLQEGETWRQEGILGTVFEGSVRVDQGQVIPTIGGRAWITSEAELIFAADDPFAGGIRFTP